MRGEDELTKESTADRNCPSHELLRKTFLTMVGDAEFPPTPAPNPPAPCWFASKMLSEITLPVPDTDMPAPKEADPPRMVKPEMLPRGPITTAVPPVPTMVVASAPSRPTRVTSLPPKFRLPG